jgi:uncharacterized membrane protein
LAILEMLDEDRWSLAMPLHKIFSIQLPSIVMASALALTLVAVDSANAQLYGLTEDASIELGGSDAVPLEGTIRLSFAGLCISLSGGQTSCSPTAYEYREIDLSAAEIELALEPLPEVPRTSLVIGLGNYDIALDDQGEVELGIVVLEREILAEGERAPGEGYIEIHELRLAPAFDISGSGYGELVFEEPGDRYPSRFRLNYALQEYEFTVIHDTGAEDGVFFLAYIEPGSESVETLGLVTLHGAAIPEPPAPLPAAGEFLGLGPSRGESHATDVSDDGRVVTGAMRSASGHSSFGYRWSQGSATLTPLGNLRGLGTGSGYAISPDGKWVTGSFDAAQYSTPSHEAARWNDALELERLEGPAEYQQSLGQGITSSGGVVGWVQVLSPYRIQAQRWDANGRRTPLPDLPSGDDGPFSRAHALSGDGSVVVGVSRSEIPHQNVATRWTEAGVENLGSLAEGAASWAWDVSADGGVVVGWGDNRSFEREGFRWTAPRGMHSLGDFAGGEHRSEAFAVSADGWFVVGYGSTENGEEAFVWDPRRGMRRLQDVIERVLGLDLAGWQLLRATGITPDGRVIVGDGINPEGFTQAWRAVLPEAATHVEIDLMPHRFPNRIRSGARLLSVVVLGSESTHVDKIDLGSLAFGPAGAAPLHDLTRRRGLRFHVRDANHDGFRDQILHFRMADTGLTPSDSQACLSGEIDNVRFVACDGVAVADGHPRQRRRSGLKSRVQGRRARSGD